MGCSPERPRTVRLICARVFGRAVIRVSSDDSGCKRDRVVRPQVHGKSGGGLYSAATNSGSVKFSLYTGPATTTGRSPRASSTLVRAMRIVLFARSAKRQGFAASC